MCVVCMRVFVRRECVCACLCVCVCVCVVLVLMCVCMFVELCLMHMCACLLVRVWWSNGVCVCHKINGTLMLRMNNNLMYGIILSLSCKVAMESLWSPCTCTLYNNKFNYHNGLAAQ